MVRRSIQSAITVCAVILTFYAGTAAGHENVSPEDDVCVRQVGENMVRLSAYQPQNNLFGQSCEEIPAAGETYLVVDLLDKSMRNMPVGLKIFRGDANEGEAITQVNANYHPDGVISGVSKLEKGLYSVVVTAEGVPPLNYYYQLRVEMTDYETIVRSWIVPIIGMMLLFWLVNDFVQSRRWRS
ncbi:hypothetical protein [Nitrosomonas communis]|uniref:hypothetical protein n=1 Tax=Nitrosomonas communis TaxID=44574 RepID=UPI0026E9AEC1|nr:hypothetical protein [Nitrosomonas communis]MCO6428639.1 hypothetical protein [Nitrosomonas communis]